jgi:hypothetical protein
MQNSLTLKSMWSAGFTFFSQIGLDFFLNTKIYPDSDAMSSLLLLPLGVKSPSSVMSVSSTLAACMS